VLTQWRKDYFAPNKKLHILNYSMIKPICTFQDKQYRLNKCTKLYKKIVSGYQKQSMGVFGLAVAVKKVAVLLWVMSCEKAKSRLVRNCCEYSKN
jgi:hypothetical protein